MHPDVRQDHLVEHLGIPPALWQPFCPFRTLREPRVEAWLVMFFRWQRYGASVLGADPEERTLRALDVLAWALRQPRVEELG